MNEIVTESERRVRLRTLEPRSSEPCTNRFDTSGLALTNMEQPNIAYGRRYVQLELPATPAPAMAAAPPTASTPTASTPTASTPGSSPAPLIAARLGRQTFERVLSRVRASSLTGLLRIPQFLPADGTGSSRVIARMNDVPDVEPGADAPVGGTKPVAPVVHPSSFGLRVVAGWFNVPESGADEEPPPAQPPGLYVVERYRLFSLARGFGLGDHLYSFTLFPDEDVEIEIKTWKRQESVDKTGSSLFDGQSEAAESEFASAVQSETGRSSKRDSAFEAHVEASGEASWGWGKASAKASASEKNARAVEEFAKDVSNATQKVANKASRERRVEITQSSEVKTSEGEEQRTKRIVRNPNKVPHAELQLLPAHPAV